MPPSLSNITKPVAWVVTIFLYGAKMVGTWVSFSGSWGFHQRMWSNTTLARDPMLCAIVMPDGMVNPTEFMGNLSKRT